MANESKERLLAGAKELFLARGYAATTVDAICERDPLENAFVFLEDLENLSPELWSGGCLLGTFALELAETNPRMQQAFAQLLQAVSDDFAGKLEPIAAHCADAPAPTAAELAETLLGTLEGSLVLAKAHRDPTRIPRALRGFRLSLARGRLATSPGLFTLLYTN